MSTQGANNKDRESPEDKARRAEKLRALVKVLARMAAEDDYEDHQQKAHASLKGSDS
jgi:uncharacterized protein with WD repeat